VIDLGCQPLCDTLLKDKELFKPETHYPLKQLWCPVCTLSQLDYIVPGEIVYHKAYPYRTGVTRELADYLDEFSRDISKTLRISSDSLVVDIGCNDGTLLSSFRNLGMRTIGVEPTGMAQYASAAGIDTIQAPFDVQVARQIVESHGQADLVTASNVFAHMQSLGSVIEGLETLIRDEGFFVLENHYLGAVMDRVQFDTIYHEHLRTYSLMSLVKLFSYYDFSVVDALKVSRYGGNIRVIIAKGKVRSATDRISQIICEEEKILKDPGCYESFRKKSIQLKFDLTKLAIECAESEAPLVGNSCPGRCSTLLNYAGIGPELMPYIAEQPASPKLGMYLPGMRIPIENNQRLLDEQPEHVMLLAWHYAKPIAQQLRSRGLRSKFFVPIPEVQRMEF
jgi:SAM-dependent methyltransferase